MGAVRLGRKRRVHENMFKFFFAISLMHVVDAIAITPPPIVDESISASEKSWQARAKPSLGLTMGTLKIEFEKTTLPQVMNVTRLGIIQHHGDAADSVNWLCYTAPTPGKSIRIWIDASGEMGGPEMRITEINVRRVADGSPPSDCPVLPNQFTPLSFENSVWLGDSESAVQKAFPSGLLRSGGQSFIGYQGKVADDGSCEGGYDLLNSLYLTFKAGIVVGINAGQVTSC